MGCKVDRQRSADFHLVLRRTGVAALDEFYEQAEVLIFNVRATSQSTELVLDGFASTTGLLGPPQRSLACGLLGLLVSCLAAVGNDVSALDLYFSRGVPGLVLGERGLDAPQLMAYRAWVELMEFLDSCVPVLQVAIPQMSPILKQSKAIVTDTEALQKACEGAGLDLEKVLQSAGANHAAIRAASKRLQWLVYKVRETLQEAETTLRELSHLSDLSPLLELSAQAMRLHLQAPYEVVEVLGPQLDQLVGQQKRLITGHS